jgi:hypothetical protein
MKPFRMSWVCWRRSFIRRIISLTRASASGSIGIAGTTSAEIGRAHV